MKSRLLFLAGASCTLLTSAKPIAEQATSLNPPTPYHYICFDPNTEKYYNCDNGEYPDSPGFAYQGHTVSGDLIYSKTSDSASTVVNAADRLCCYMLGLLPVCTPCTTSVVPNESKAGSSVVQARSIDGDHANQVQASSGSTDDEDKQCCYWILLYLYCYTCPPSAAVLEASTTAVPVDGNLQVARHIEAPAENVAEMRTTYVVTKTTAVPKPPATTIYFPPPPRDVNVLDARAEDADELRTTYVNTKKTATSTQSISSIFFPPRGQDAADVTANMQFATLTNGHRVRTYDFHMTCAGMFEHNNLQCKNSQEELTGDMCSSMCSCNNFGEMDCKTPGGSNCDTEEVTNFCKRGSPYWTCACSHLKGGPQTLISTYP